ncbi:MAG: hypothetical protein SGCHY_000840 [Lobulomycetales sp.]
MLDSCTYDPATALEKPLKITQNGLPYWLLPCKLSLGNALLSSFPNPSVTLSVSVASPRANQSRPSSIAAGDDPDNNLCGTETFDAINLLEGLCPDMLGGHLPVFKPQDLEYRDRLGSKDLNAEYREKLRPQQHSARSRSSSVASGLEAPAVISRVVSLAPILEVDVVVAGISETSEDVFLVLNVRNVTTAPPLARDTLYHHQDNKHQGVVYELEDAKVTMSNAVVNLESESLPICIKPGESAGILMRVIRLSSTDASTTGGERPVSASRTSLDSSTSITTDHAQQATSPAAVPSELYAMDISVFGSVSETIADKPPSRRQLASRYYCMADLDPRTPGARVINPQYVSSSSGGGGGKSRTTPVGKPGMHAAGAASGVLTPTPLEPTTAILGPTGPGKSADGSRGVGDVLVSLSLESGGAGDGGGAAGGGGGGGVRLNQVFTMQVLLVNTGDTPRNLRVCVPDKYTRAPLPATRCDARVPMLEAAAVLPTNSAKQQPVGIVLDPHGFYSRYMEFEKREASIVCLEEETTLSPLAGKSCVTCNLHFVPIKGQLHTIKELIIVDLDSGEQDTIHNGLSVFII